MATPFQVPSAIGRVEVDAKHIIAVASGKGGVGKSTVSTNLALAIAATGLKTGLLDADIYGPNVPLMLGVEHSAAMTTPENKILPVEAYGLKMMSVGFITQTEKALIWRGPLANRLIGQFLEDVLWEDLDVMVIDLPPGTGDVPLSIVQKCKLAGGLIVTTPQEASIADVKKMIDMFKSTKAPILGVVENMKYLNCPDCSKRIELYPNREEKGVAKQLGEKLLAEFPFEPNIGVKTDGKPFYINEPGSPLVKDYNKLAEAVLKQIQ
ncbi:MAG: Mrp/NBP35 family ATP-binding protein [bacterium]|nr:Mrp/NBP35 family ATP-binding protein [bacterium]